MESPPNVIVHAQGRRAVDARRFRRVAGIQKHQAPPSFWLCGVCCLETKRVVNSTECQAPGVATPFIIPRKYLNLRSGDLTTPTETRRRPKGLLRVPWHSSRDAPVLTPGGARPAKRTEIRFTSLASWRPLSSSPSYQSRGAFQRRFASTLAAQDAHASGTSSVGLFGSLQEALTPWRHFPPRAPPFPARPES